MCGITGVIQLRGEPREVVPKDVLVRMTDAMTHRGPDSRGLHVEPGVALGMRRLAIVDVAGGNQPFANESGEVDDAQAAHAERDARLDVEAVLVGAAMADDIRHRPQAPKVDGRAPRVAPGNSADAAHSTLIRSAGHAPCTGSSGGSHAFDG